MSKPAKFRKKPVVIEAYQHFGCDEDFRVLEEWGCPIVWDTHLGGPILPYIATLEGHMALTPGDYVIRGIQGEFYACDEAIFSETYEAVGDHDEILADIAAHEEDRRHFTAAAEDLEHLNAHVDRLQELHTGYEWLISDSAQEIGRLQRLINTWAATWIYRRDPERSAEHRAAEADLLRAAADHGAL